MCKTECIADLDKLNLARLSGFSLMQMLAYDTTTPKNAFQLKSGHKRPKNNHLTTFYEGWV